MKVSNRTEPVEKIVEHTSEGRETEGGARSLVRYLATIVGGYHEVCDNKEAITCARDDQVVAGAAGMNARGWHVCAVGSAHQRPEGWADPYSHAELTIMANRTARACLRLGIPAVRLDVGRVAQNGYKGICGHTDVSKAYGLSTHTDPGPDFPWDTFMLSVQAQVNGVPASEDDVPKGTDRVDGFAAKNGGTTVVHADGGVFCYGSQFLGSMGGTGLVMGVNDIISALETPSGSGYWLLGRDGGIFSFGDAQYRGNGVALAKYACEAIELIPNGDGYGIVYECVVQPSGGVLVPGT